MQKDLDFSNLTRKQIADIVGKNERTITRWVQDGCPRSRSGRYNAPAVINWLLDRQADTVDASDADSPALERYRTARAQLAELELEDRRGRFVEREWVEQQLASRAMILKSDLSNFGYARVPEIISLAHGDQAYAPDAIQFFVSNLDKFLGRYSQPIDPEEK